MKRFSFSPTHFFFSKQTQYTHWIWRIGLCLLLGLSSNMDVIAQDQKAIIDETVNTINCEMVKLFLISFDRPIAAKSIRSCEYHYLKNAVNKVRENKLKGYKQDIMRATTLVNNYKTSLIQTDDYISVFQSLNATVLNQFDNICQKYQQSSKAKICVNLNQKLVSLERKMNALTDNALADLDAFKIRAPIETMRAVEPPIETKTRPATVPKFEEERQVETETAKGPIKEEHSHIWKIVVTGIIALLILAIGWLYKDLQQAQQRLRDVESILRIINKERATIKPSKQFLLNQQMDDD